MFKNKKFLIILILTCLGMELIAMIPTFSKLKSENTTNTEYEWNKEYADSFHSGTGTIDDPYIISNASELAYFSKALESNNFKDKYIKLSNDIVINKGFFKDGDIPLYIYDDIEYYLNRDNNKYYLEDNFITEKGSINDFNSLNGFKGTLDGDFHTIYGLYLKGSNAALFTNLSGSISNLFIENAYIYGDYEASGVVLDSYNASLKNIVFNGNVISNKEKENILTDKIDDMVINGQEKLDLQLPLVTSSNYSFVLKGVCSGNVPTFKINDKDVECNQFNVEVNPYDITISSIDNINLTNLEYVLTYNTSLSSGIISRSSNTILSGLVNKGNVSGINSAGIIGINYNSNLIDSYNLGNINGSNTSGIVDTILLSDIQLKNVYNNGILNNNSSGLVNNMIGSNVSFINDFNTFLTKPINNMSTSTISVYNSFNSIEANLFGLINFDIIKTLYPSYIDDSNIVNGNIWIFDEVPILYFDEVNKKYVDINIDDYSWDSYHSDLKDISFKDDIAIRLNAKEEYKPIKQVYYYISNDTLDKESLNSLEWNNQYNGIITISKKGSYVLYVKVVDYNDNVYYINSDRLNLNINSFYASISNNDLTWDTYHDPSNIYINSNKEYSIMAFDKNSGIASIKYYISDQILDNNVLDSIVEWNDYTDKFIVDSNNYIVYVKVISTDGKALYINSDKMINKAYHVSNLKSGDNTLFNNNMTYNSKFNFDITLDHSNLDFTKTVRYLKTNNKLPENTLIILKDLKTKNVYKYEVGNIDTYNKEIDSYLYPLKDFVEIGKMTFIKNFDDDFFNDQENEEFNISISFNNIKPINGTYEFSLLALNNNYSLDTSNMVSINLTKDNIDINKYLSINSDYIDSFIYNTDTIKSIPLSLSLINNNLNTNYENMHLGISIEVVDSNNKKVEAINYKGIKFRYNDHIYTPNSNNITLIDLGTNYNQDIILDIIGNIDNTSYINGTYYFKITSYLFKNIKIKKYESENSVLIPLIFNKDYTKLDYSFNVWLDNSSIIDTENNRIINFNIIENGNLANPNVRVSLYKKKALTAYNQEYVLIDLNKYIENGLVGDNKIYYALTNPKSYDINESINKFSLILKDNIESNGYMFKFQLYDGDNLVGETSIKAIIR